MITDDNCEDKLIAVDNIHHKMLFVNYTDTIIIKYLCRFPNLVNQI